jgi:hypothetical protein
MDWPRPFYTFGHEERPQDPSLVRLTKNSILKTQWEKPEWRKEHVRLADLHTPTLLTVVFGLTSTVKGAFGDEVYFGVVTTTTFILNASPPFASVLPSGPPCISLFALVLSDADER